MAMPMYLLYEGGMIMARILIKMRREAQERARKRPGPPDPVRPDGRPHPQPASQFTRPAVGGVPDLSV